MARANRSRGFTLIELLVVVAIIALLISILLPSLSQAREQGKKAVCLSNLKSIAQASHTYAVEDEREQLIPLSPAHARYEITADGFTGVWGWRTALPYSYGGRTPQKNFPDGGGSIMRAEDGEGGNGWWEAHRRPLNKYVYGSVDAADAKKLRMFQCPSDKGYPNSPWTVGKDRDCPEGAAEIPLYDMLGNSFRINTCGTLYVSGGSVNVSMQSSAEGHTSSSIINPSRVVMYCEPLFYAMSRQELNADPTVSRLTGWHGKVMTDDAAYCDGSAAATKADQLAVFDETVLKDMNYTSSADWNAYLRRGKTWQTDAYPTPGAYIKRFTFNNSGLANTYVDNGYTGWPYDNAQSNRVPK